jgi:hypothetical protein
LPKIHGGYFPNNPRIYREIKQEGKKNEENAITRKNKERESKNGKPNKERRKLMWGKKNSCMSFVG